MAYLTERQVRQSLAPFFLSPLVMGYHPTAAHVLVFPLETQSVNHESKLVDSAHDPVYICPEKITSANRPHRLAIEIRNKTHICSVDLPDPCPALVSSLINRG